MYVYAHHITPHIPSKVPMPTFPFLSFFLGPSSVVTTLRRSERLVLLGAHEALEVLDALLVDGDLGDPAAAGAVVLGNLVDVAGLLLELLVDVGDAAGDRGVDVGGRLDRLDGADGVARLDLAALLGQLHVDDVAQSFGSVLGDANHARLVVGRQVDPLMVFGVLPYGVYLRQSTSLSVRCFVCQGVPGKWGEIRKERKRSWPASALGGGQETVLIAVTEKALAVLNLWIGRAAVV